MKKKLTVVGGLLLSSLLSIPGISAQGQEVIQDTQENAVRVIMSSSERSGSHDWFTKSYVIENKNTEKNSLFLFPEDGSNLNTIEIDERQEHQSLLGMGISIEETTVFNLRRMSPETRKEIIRNWLDPVNGMGNTLFRLTIGSSDFTGKEFYSYYDGNGQELDGKPDWYNETGKGFSIQKDIDYGIIEIVKEVQAEAKNLGVEKDLKFFASSWSPPGWMKSGTFLSWIFPNNGLGLKGGNLKDENIPDLAKYFSRFLEEYQKQGIPIYAVTLQNETGFETNYPSAIVTATQEAQLSKLLKAEIQKSEVLKDSVPTKIWAWDFNFSGSEEFITDLFRTDDGVENVDGLAFHPYSGTPPTMGRLYEEYKDRYTFNLTERAVWGTSGANDIISWFRNGAESYNGWVTMMDSNIAPHQWTGTPDPSLFIQDANNHDRYWITPEVYIIGQFSKYIRPGYVRVESNNGKNTTVTNVVFKNKETGDLVLVATNQSGKNQTFKVSCNGKQFVATLPAGNTATYLWHPGARSLDKSELEAAIETATSLTPSVGNQYTVESKVVFDEALVAAKAILTDDASVQSTIDEAVLALNTAIASLVEVPLSVEVGTLYRVYNPNSGEHLYTLSEGEAANLVDLGWKNEGLAWKTPATGIPVFRLYNPNSGEHFYTCDESEYEAVAAAGWNQEGVAFFSSDTEELPIYRLFNPNAEGAGSHHFTQDENEATGLVALGWKHEGTAFYGTK